MKPGGSLRSINIIHIVVFSISDTLRKMVKQGSLVRIVNNKLVATNGTTGK